MVQQESWEDKEDLPSREGGRSTAGGGGGGEEDEVTPLAQHPETAVCLHLQYEAWASPTPRGLVPPLRIRSPTGQVSLREVRMVCRAGDRGQKEPGERNNPQGPERVEARDVAPAGTESPNP